MGPVGNKRAKANTVRGNHWRLLEVMLMLDKVAEILPRGGNDWETVATSYNAERAQSYVQYGERDAESLKNKFKVLKMVEARSIYAKYINKTLIITMSFQI